MAYIDVLTVYGIIECIVFAQQYTKMQDLIIKGKKIVVLAKKSGSQFVFDNAKLFDDWKTERKETKINGGN